MFNLVAASIISAENLCVSNDNLYQLLSLHIREVAPNIDSSHQLLGNIFHVVGILSDVCLSLLHVHIV